jgi:hypothetical protein
VYPQFFLLGYFIIISQLFTQFKAQSGKGLSKANANVQRVILKKKLFQKYFIQKLSKLLIISFSVDQVFLKQNK